MGKANITFVALLSVILICFTSCKKDEKTTIYKIAILNEIPPYSYTQSGNLIGMDIDIFKEIASSQDIKYVFIPGNAGSTLNYVTSGEIDGAMSGIGITDARKRSFDMAEYCIGGLTFVSSSANSAVNTCDDLAGKKVGLFGNTISNIIADSLQAVYHFEIVAFPQGTAIYDTLVAGTVDAVFGDLPSIGYNMTLGKQLKLVDGYRLPMGIGFAVKKNTNTELYEKFNAGLKEMQSNGKLKAILTKYINNI